MQPQTQSQTKDQFWATYWFTPLQMITVVNPQSYDYQFMVEGRTFIIKAGAKDKIPGTVANIYLSNMTRIQAQDDDKMSHLSDFALMKLYYDELIIDVESLVNEVDNTPAYLKNVPEHLKVAGEPETPPWQEKTSTLPQHNSTMSDEWTPPAQKAPEVKEETKEFELNGSKFKMITSKRGNTMYYKDGHLTSEAEYAKNASLL